MRTHLTERPPAVISARLGPRLMRLAPAVILAVILVAPFVKLAALYRGDDYLITLRYGRNAANGIGAVFNEGVYCQGFTSPLHFILSYILCRAGFGLEGVPATICLLGLLSIVVLGINLAYWVNPKFSYVGLFVALCAILSSNSFMGHVGFDTVLAAGLAATAVSLFVASRYGPAGLLLGLGTLARHDISLLAVFLFGVLVVTRKWRGCLRLTAFYLAATFPWYLFAALYYGSPLPNTLHAKMVQGRSGIPLLTQTFREALRYPIIWYPLHNRVLIGVLVLLSGAAMAAIFWQRRKTLKKQGGSALSLVPHALLHPLFLFVAFAFLYDLAYFAVLRVPASFTWYHVYPTYAVYSIAAFGVVRLAGMGEDTLRELLRKGDIPWRSFPILILTIGIVAGSVYFWQQHFRKHVPHDDPGRYRYEGYRAAAEWINARARSTDVVFVGEIGVFGWYCPLYIEDAAALVMPPVPLNQRRFRYAVWQDDPRFPPQSFVRCPTCKLRARFPNPHEVDILVFERKGISGTADRKTDFADS